MTMIIDGSAGVTFPNSTVQASAGQVLQVVQGTATGSASTTSNSFVTSGLTASITPKFSNSKILATVTLVNSYISLGSTFAYYTLYRNSTNLASGSGNNQACGNLYNGAGTLGGNVVFQLLDSPATTSSTTYTVYFNQSGSATAYINAFGGSTSYITLQEIAA